MMKQNTCYTHIYIWRLHIPIHELFGNWLDLLIQDIKLTQFCFNGLDMIRKYCLSLKLAKKQSSNTKKNKVDA